MLLTKQILPSEQVLAQADVPVSLLMVILASCDLFYWHTGKKESPFPNLSCKIGKKSMGTKEVMAKKALRICVFYSWVVMT